MDLEEPDESSGKSSVRAAGRQVKLAYLTTDVEVEESSGTPEDCRPLPLHGPGDDAVNIELHGGTAKEKGAQQVERTVGVPCLAGVVLHRVMKDGSNSS